METLRKRKNARRSRTIGFIQGKSIILSDHAIERTNERRIDENLLLKAIALHWRSVERQDLTPYGHHVAIKVRLEDVYNFFPESIRSAGKYNIYDFGEVTIKRIVPKLNMRNLSKRSNDSTLFLNLDKEIKNGQEVITVITALVKKLEPHVTPNTILIA